MMRVGDANLGIDSHTALAAQHHRCNSSQVRLKRDHLELIHQLRIVGQHNRYPGGFLNCRRYLPIVLLGSLYPPLDLSYRGKVFLEFSAIRSAELPRQLLSVIAYRIQDAASIESSPRARFRIDA